MTLPAWMLQPILDDPDDDAPRLIAAEYLEERGELEHGEFIRVQIALSLLQCDWTTGKASVNQLPPCETHNKTRGLNSFCVSCNKMNSLKARSNELIRVCKYPANGWVWAGEPLNRIDDAEYNYNRGFIDWVKCSWSDCEKHLDKIIAEHPVTRVEISDRAPHCGRFDRYAETVPTEHRGAEYWIWDLQPQNAVASNFLPWEVYQHLDRPMNRWHCQYPTEAAARDALSAAVIAWARAKRRAVAPAPWAQHLEEEFYNDLQPTS